MNAQRRENPWLRLTWGVVLLIVGTIVWLDRMDRIDARDYLEWWPLALIAVGLAHLPQRRIVGAVLWIIAGTFLLLPLFGIPIEPWRIVGLWPLLISLAGITLILQALRPRRAGSSFSMVAVMGANVRSVGSQEIAGGDVVAVMGGCDVDLSAAHAAGGEVTIDVTAFWGGIVIRVPAGWQVIDRVMGILGGFSALVAPAADGAPRLIVSGSAIMGGVEVKSSA